MTRTPRAFGAHTAKRHAAAPCGCAPSTVHSCSCRPSPIRCRSSSPSVGQVPVRVVGTPRRRRRAGSRAPCRAPRPRRRRRRAPGSSGAARRRRPPTTSLGARAQRPDDRACRRPGARRGSQCGSCVSPAITLVHGVLVGGRGGGGRSRSSEGVSRAAGRSTAAGCAASSAGAGPRRRPRRPPCPARTPPAARRWSRGSTPAAAAYPSQNASWLRSTHSRARRRQLLVVVARPTSSW